MINRILSLILGDTRRDGWRHWLWLGFFVLAPLAFFAGLELHERNARRRTEPFADPARMVAAARAAAAAEGVNTQGWRVISQLIMSDAFQEFPQRRETAARLPESQRRWAPATTIRVILQDPSRTRWFAVSLRPDASVARFETSTNLHSPQQEVTEAEASRMARERFSTFCPARDLDMGEPELLNATGVGFATRRFVWRGDFPTAAGLQAQCWIEVYGNRIRAASVEINWTGNADRGSVIAQAFAQVRAVVILLLFLYGIYRFSRRALEREVPWDRCAVILGVMLVFGTILQVINPHYGTGSLTVAQALGPTAWAITAGVVITFSLQGMLLALTYGAGEGELRETYPGKLTAWDTLVTGRIWSRNVGAALLYGAAAGAWAILARAVTWEGLGVAHTIHEQNLIFTYGPLPWLMQMINEPILAMFVVTAAVLLPLMFAARNLARPLLRRLVVIVLAVFGASVGGAFSLNSLADIVVLVSTAALVLSVFWFRDLLASLAAVVTFNTFGLIEDFGVLVPVWSEYSTYALVLSGVTLLAALVMTLRAPHYQDDAVRPVYARRLAERLLMQTEVSAARDAQLRLLPDQPPQLPGLAVEAACQPAREVGGDFYDFFVLPRQRLGILTAEGGSAGLASALTIGLAKGFLLYAARRDWTAAEALRRLSPILRDATHQAIERLGLAYLTIDPPTRAVQVARLGAYPRVFRIQDRGGSEIALFEIAGEARLAEAKITLAPGESLVIVTDGLVKRFLAKREHPLEQWLAQIDGRVAASAASLKEDLFHQAGGSQGDLDDDLTAVVLRFDRTPVVERVEVA